MLNVLRNNETKQTLTAQGHELLVVYRTSDLPKDWAQYAGIVVNTDSEKTLLEIVKKVRCEQGTLSLIPLFVNELHTFQEELLSHTDGKVHIAQVDTIVKKAIKINKRLGQIITPLNLSVYEVQIQFKTLAFLYSRKRLLTPFTSRKSKIGYYFPMLSLWNGDDSLGILKALETMQHGGLITSTFKDHVHLCKNCSGNYLNFKEICPSCHDADIQARDMIHHFVCAHVAPEDDFKKGDHLSCPKCDKKLRHIGIDYDKPSAIFLCNSCTNEFQNPQIQAACFDCEKENSLSELLQKTIGEYSITAKGEQWLLNYHTSLKEEKHSHPASLKGISFPIFKLMARQELKRVAATGTQSTLGSIAFQNDEIEFFNSDMKAAIQAEMEKIIQSYLTDVDLLYSEAYNKFYFLLPDTLASNCERLEQIRYNLSKLLTDNLTDTMPVVMHTHQLKKEDEIDLLLNTL